MQFNNQSKRGFKVSERATLRVAAGSKVLRTSLTVSRSGDGYSLLELLIVVALIGALTSIALPQLLAQRRLSRSVGITREILTELRLTRQLAMSERQAFTFQYDNVNKQISVIDHNDNPGPTTLVNGTYPNTAKTKVISLTPLAETATSAEMEYGIPNTFPNGPLGDGIAMTALNGGQFNITFQPDGSVVKASGDPDDNAMFLYNTRAPAGTASAISIMGASGRAKIWRYDAGRNRYVE